MEWTVDPETLSRVFNRTSAESKAFTDYLETYNKNLNDNIKDIDRAIMKQINDHMSHKYGAYSYVQSVDPTVVVYVLTANNWLTISMVTLEKSYIEITHKKVIKRFNLLNFTFDEIFEFMS